MSTIAYAALTGKREEATPGKSTTSESPGLRTYVDALAALVPAEVLTAHGAILTFTTVTGKDGQVSITSIDPLFYSFWALIVVSMLLYGAGRMVASRWDNWDFVRILIPPLAFVGWTMVQKASAFDAVKLHSKLTFSDAAQSATAIIGAIVLGMLASALAYKADQK